MALALVVGERSNSCQFLPRTQWMDRWLGHRTSSDSVDKRNILSLAQPVKAHSHSLYRMQCPYSNVDKSERIFRNYVLWVAQKSLVVAVDFLSEIETTLTIRCQTATRYSSEWRR
jgi:hypothetical protein